MKLGTAATGGLREGGKMIYRGGRFTGVAMELVLLKQDTAFILFREKEKKRNHLRRIYS